MGQNPKIMEKIEKMKIHQDIKRNQFKYFKIYIFISKFIYATWCIFYSDKLHLKMGIFDDFQKTTVKNSTLQTLNPL